MEEQAMKEREKPRGMNLPPLTREELAALGDRPVLVDAGDQAWWDSLSETERTSVRETAGHGLMARSLTRGSGKSFEVDPWVRLILGARSAPAWLLIATGVSALRAYGLGPGSNGNVLVEHQPAPGLYHFTAVLAEASSEAVAAVVLHRPDAEPELRRIEVFRPEHLDRPERRALLVTPAGAQMATVDANLQVGDYRPADLATVTAEIERLTVVRA